MIVPKTFASLWLLLASLAATDSHAQVYGTFDLADTSGSDMGMISFVRSKDLRGECIACRLPGGSGCNPECFSDVFGVWLVCHNKTMNLELGPISPKDRPKLEAEVARIGHLIIQSPGQRLSLVITETSFLLRDSDGAFDLRLAAGYQPSLADALKVVADVNRAFTVIVGKRRYTIDAGAGTGPTISGLIQRCSG